MAAETVVSLDSVFVRGVWRLCIDGTVFRRQTPFFKFFSSIFEQKLQGRVQRILPATIIFKNRVFICFLRRNNHEFSRYVLDASRGADHFCLQRRVHDVGSASAGIKEFP